MLRFTSSCSEEDLQLIVQNLTDQRKDCLSQQRDSVNQTMQAAAMGSITQLLTCTLVAVHLYLLRPPSPH
ncbi:hypothetical protein CgunFtcFv8_001230 [Champsocephalus gunnari]|uniref:Uncharacterized protein n=1 Tax=Champsocephalus gunnari TaxID=52237 RepID=A0AAN8DJH3_CHAGU|nr:hypothetical protein CgunFtcFv8_001230 [Champsocephalus gunnari]